MSPKTQNTVDRRAARMKDQRHGFSPYNLSLTRYSEPRAPNVWMVKLGFVGSRPKLDQLQLCNVLWMNNAVLMTWRVKNHDWTSDRVDCLMQFLGPIKVGTYGCKPQDAGDTDDEHISEQIHFRILPADDLPQSLVLLKTQILTHSGHTSRNKQGLKHKHNVTLRYCRATLCVVNTNYQNQRNYNIILKHSLTGKFSGASASMVETFEPWSDVCIFPFPVYLFIVQQMGNDQKIELKELGPDKDKVDDMVQAMIKSFLLSTVTHTFWHEPQVLVGNSQLP
ncbi:hypothetical protein MVEN_02304100 [Mycena venus]|uniref:Uncharacterized protein n=1 Tax=Mycena venus TaxID=2733690 RepID=A0A8H6X4I5_9AGAR|nr:hypothetical protein MVEN_02304100 [Mycena venus]